MKIKAQAIKQNENNQYQDIKKNLFNSQQYPQTTTASTKQSVVLPASKLTETKRLTYISVTDNKIVSRGQSFDRQAEACKANLAVIEESRHEARFSRRRKTNTSSVIAASLSSVSNYREKDSGMIDFNSDLRLTEYGCRANDIPVYNSMIPV